MKITVREERPGDIVAICALNSLAFGQEQEGQIVNALRRNAAAHLSLVAIVEGKIVGHILYSPATIGGLDGVALGPMAVHPDFQGKGIGSKLVEEGNARMKKEGCPFVIVLGHADYYPRFGFTPAGNFGISCEWNVPDDVFMILVLDEARMRCVSGKALYRPEFSTVD